MPSSPASLLMEVDGIRIYEPTSGGKAGKGQNKTSTIQVHMHNRIAAAFRFDVSDHASRDRAIEKAKAWAQLPSGITRQQWQIMRNALGLDMSKTLYRNHYCVAPDHADVNALVKRGFMKPGQVINDGRSQYFHVTLQGAIAIGVNAAKFRKAQENP